MYFALISIESHLIFGHSLFVRNTFNVLRLCALFRNVN